MMFGRKCKKLEIENIELKAEKAIAAVKEHLEFQLTESRQENSKLRSTVADLQKQLADANSKLREQTEADIYFSCAKIMKKLEAGEEKGNLLSDYDYMLKQKAATQARQSNYQGILNYLDFGSIR